jgi:hypothetical protein
MSHYLTLFRARAYREHLNVLLSLLLLQAHSLFSLSYIYIFENKVVKYVGGFSFPARKSVTIRKNTLLHCYIVIIQHLSS